MSRDWTPKELYQVNKFFKEKDGVSLFDIAKGMKWSYNEQEEPFLNELESGHMNHFPLLGFLLSSFETLYKQLSELPNGLVFLESKERELEKYVSGNLENIPEESYTIRWFNGKLDPSFYYRETNNELFMEKLLAEANENQ